MTARTPSSVAVHQVLATLGYGDAIGNEVLGIQQALRRAGFASEIFVETADARLEEFTRDYRELPDASRPENLLIHHFSIGSKASRTAFALPERMVLVYHNITPPEYFIDVNPMLVGQCYWGRRELALLVPRCELALGDSEYNRQELAEIGFDPTAVLPVVPSFAHLDVPPSPLLAGDFDDGWTNVLFVGRMIPNKRIEDVIRCFHAYRKRYNPRTRLLLVGAFRGFERYHAMLQQLIGQLETPDVHFLDQVSNEELTALYDVADLFLCASEHEGFCVPIVEAFYKGVPVIARASSAVPATMDGAGVLYEGKDPGLVSELMNAIVSDVTLQDAILAGQDAALERLWARDFDGLLLQYVDQALSSPRRAEYDVAFDFWDQFELAERLEELRQYRPALYLALPKPDAGDT